MDDSKGGLVSSCLSALAYIIREVILRPIDILLDYAHDYYNPTYPNAYLRGNNLPVRKEITAFRLPVTRGAIPDGLRGEFVRNGPNPWVIQKGGYHWFDGDGMLHGVRLAPDGSVAYVNRFIRTKLYLAEFAAGRSQRFKLGQGKGKIGMAKAIFAMVKTKLGILPDVYQTANTALTFHNRKLQALVEADVPYEIRVLLDGQLETGARLDYGGKISAMTAHPKVDPVTKEFFFFSYSYVEPKATYGLIDPLGNLVRTFVIDLPVSVMMHDFAITPHYAVLFDFCLVYDRKRLARGRGLYEFDPSHQARIGVFDRYAENGDDIVWFNIAPCFAFHTVNAWEDGDDIVIHACRTTKFNMDSIFGDSFFELVEWRCNTKTRVSQEVVVLPGTFVDFPYIHPDLVGRKTQYAYLAAATVFDKQNFDFDSIIKMDLQAKRPVNTFTYGKNKTGGEAVFVPKTNGTSEDDGYLMTFVYDRSTEQSSFWIIDSKSMSDIIAIVDLPQRVPNGFHGLFMSEEQIRSQRLK